MGNYPFGFGTRTVAGKRRLSCPVLAGCVEPPAKHHRGKGMGAWLSLLCVRCTAVLLLMCYCKERPQRFAATGKHASLAVCCSAGRPKELRLSYAAARGRGMGGRGARIGGGGGRGRGRGRGKAAAAAGTLGELAHRCCPAGRFENLHINVHGPAWVAPCTPCAPSPT